MTCRIARVFSVLALAVTATGCPHPVGQCQYGSAGGESWTGEIIEMVVVDDAQGPVHILVVQGESTVEFRISDEQYQSCLASHDLEVGDEVGVEIQYGGPCPPMKRLMDCPFGG